MEPRQASNLVESAKWEHLRREIEALVSKGMESPRFEFTRKCSLSANDRKSQADFAKTIQGMSNAYPAEERIYIVGADQRERKFYPLDNAREFDSANVRQILESLLEPTPLFETSVLDTELGDKYAAILLSAEQPRPILVKGDVGASDGKGRLLNRGEIWIKKNTGLDRATRDDVERMYEMRIEAEAERRAQQRFGHMREGVEASIRLQLSPERKIPSEDLVFGPDAEYQAYVLQLVANSDGLRLNMLLTTLSDLLIEKWYSLGAYDAEGALVQGDFNAKVREHLRNTYYPASRRLLFAGLLLMKYGAGSETLRRIGNLLAEAFEAPRKLTALPGPHDAAGLVSTGTVALEPLLAARILATYAMRMEKYSHLPVLLQKNVHPVGSRDNRKRVPFLFWPLRMNVPGNDRIAYAFQNMVKPHWMGFFGSEQSFLDAACRLEFILHLNSFLACKNTDAQAWLAKFRPDLDFGYWYASDLWRYPLQSVVGLAEKLYENLAMGPDAPLLLDFSIEHGVFKKAFQPSELSLTGNEQNIFVAYLQKLVEWQASAAMSVPGGFHLPEETDWGPILGPLVG